MIKKLIYVILSFVIIFSVTGCDEMNKPKTVNEIEYEVIDSNTLEQSIQFEIEEIKYQKGYTYWEIEDGSYKIFIGLGEKPTGGYGIQVKSIQDNGRITVIQVEKTEPDPNDMVTQALTYPYVVIKVNNITNNFIVIDQNDEEYDKIELMPQNNNDVGMSGTMLRYDLNVVDYSKPIVCTYQGKVDKNTIEIKIENVDELIPLYADNIEKYLDGISIGDKIEIIITISPSDQIQIDSITKIE